MAEPTLELTIDKYLQHIVEKEERLILNTVRNSLTSTKIDLCRHSDWEVEDLRAIFEIIRENLDEALDAKSITKIDDLESLIDFL